MSNDKPQANYWVGLLADIDQEGGGGGTFSKFTCYPGYWAMCSGITGDDREKCLFTFDDTKKDDWKRAKAEAKKFWAANNGTGKGPDRSIIVRYYADTALYGGGDKANWDSGDQFQDFPLWQIIPPKDGSPLKPSGTQDLMSFMEQNKVKLGVDYWGRNARVNNPYKVHMQQMDGEPDDDGSPTYKRIRMPVEVFASQKEWAKAVTDASSADAASSDYPWAGFPGETWTGPNADLNQEIIDLEVTLLAWKEEEEDLATACIDQNGEDVTWCVRALNVGGMKVKKIATLTNMSKDEVKAMLA